MRKHALTAILLGCICSTLQAQQPAPSPDPAPEPYVLHVYTNLIQIPTLLLSEEMKPVPAIPKDNFEIRIDSGPAFHPTSLRREGNDPISLALLLDTSGDTDELVKVVADSFPLLAPKLLHPEDHVSIFALDCKLIRSIDDAPASPDTLKKGITAALEVDGLHNGKKKGSCGNSLLLRNAIGQITHALGDSPGRRVLLAVTDGHDAGSSVKWAELQTYAASKGVAIFGMRDLFYSRYGLQPLGLSDARGKTWPFGMQANEDLFRELCDNNGGILRGTTRFQVAKDLEQFVTTLRERYIVEFPRPDDSQPGMHDIQIHIAGKNHYLIHAAGVSISLPDPNAAADPNTVPVSKSPATYGTRKPLKPSH